MLIDTHCHVSFEAYKDDAEEVVKRALAAGVQMVTIGTRIETSVAAVKFAEAHEGVWATIGLHPGHVHAQEYVDKNEVPADQVGAGHAAEVFDAEAYRKLLAHPKVVAIGECGLDYYHAPKDAADDAWKTEQQAVCRAQLKLASEAGKPVVIHCRDAHQDQARLIRDEIAAGGLARRGVIHCFTGTAEEAAMYRELGFMVAFGGIITFGKSVADAAAQVPLDQIVLETDAPYLAPAPYRGKRNEPAYVTEVARKLATLKGTTVEEISRVTTENAKRLFQI